MSIRPIPSTPEQVAQEQWCQEAAIAAAKAINNEYDETTMGQADLNRIINRHTLGNSRASAMALMIVIEALCNGC